MKIWTEEHHIASELLNDMSSKLEMMIDVANTCGYEGIFFCKLDLLIRIGKISELDSRWTRKEHLILKLPFALQRYNPSENDYPLSIDYFHQQTCITTNITDAECLETTDDPTLGCSTPHNVDEITSVYHWLQSIQKYTDLRTLRFFSGSHLVLCPTSPRWDHSSWSIDFFERIEDLVSVSLHDTFTRLEVVELTTNFLDTFERDEINEESIYPLTYSDFQKEWKYGEGNYASMD